MVSKIKVATVTFYSINYLPVKVPTKSVQLLQRLGGTKQTDKYFKMDFLMEISMLTSTGKNALNINF